METPLARPVEISVDTRGARIVEEEGSPEDRDGRDIYLPNYVESVSHIAVDVGGSLAKVVYFTRTLGGSTTSSANASPLLGSDQRLEAEHFHNRLSELQASDARFSYAGHPAATSPTNGLFRINGEDHSRENSFPDTSPSSSIMLGASALPTKSSSSSTHGSEARKGRSGTLTPTTVLREHHGGSKSVFSSMQSSFLKRRSLPSALPGGRLNFIKFETDHIDDCIGFLSELIDRSAKAANVSREEMRKGVKLTATGGGAHLFYEKFEKELGVEVRKEDEMGCLITGLNFMTLIPEEVFSYSDELVSHLHDPLPTHDGPDTNGHNQAAGPSTSSSQASSSNPNEALPRPSPNPPLYAPVFDSNPSPKLPCLLVNIGSGVSIIKVDDYGKFERVSGTSLGGGTLWGLLSLLTDASSFDEMLELSEKGDNSNVDMLVGDIYGSVGYNTLGLKSSTIASSFGKVFRKDGSQKGGAEGRKRKFKPEDICKSLLYAISNNIGQIAYMNAEKYDLDRIYFGGCFIRGHKATISTLSYAIRFWSRGTKRAFFLRHEGYLGAIGAWIKHISIADPQAPSASSGKALSSSSAIDTPVAPLVSPSGRSRTHSSSESSSERQSFSSAQRAAVDQGEATSHQSNLNPLLAEALGMVSPAGEAPGQQSLSTSSSAATVLSGNNESSLPRSGSGSLAIAPALSRIASHRSREDDREEEYNATRQENGAHEEGAQDDGEHESLEDMISSLSPSDRAILAPVLEQLESGRGKALSEGLSDQALTNAGASAKDDSANIADLLARLEAADVAADGLEDKLDVLLARLDGILSTKEAGQVQMQQEMLVER